MSCSRHDGEPVATSTTVCGGLSAGAPPQEQPCTALGGRRSAVTTRGSLLTCRTSSRGEPSVENLSAEGKQRPCTRRPASRSSLMLRKIDGASKDPNTGAWHLWSVSDIEAAQGTRIDLRILENETELAPAISHVIQKRLQTIQYRLLPDTQESNAGGSEALATWMPTTGVEGHGA
jgi:hypothetical protein